MSAMESEIRKLRSPPPPSAPPQLPASASTKPNSPASAPGKAIFKFVQLEKAAQTWSRALLPAVGKAMDKAFDEITPPMPDAIFRQDLERLKAETRVATQRLVTKHLELQRADVTSTLRSAPKSITDPAAQIAQSYATKQFPKDKPDKLKTLIEQANAFIGSGVTTPKAS